MLIAVLGVVYVLGFLTLALLIRRTTDPRLLDREAAFIACVLWPGAAVLFVCGTAAIFISDRLWPNSVGPNQ